MGHQGLCSISSTLLMLACKCVGKGKCYPRGLPINHLRYLTLCSFPSSSHGFVLGVISWLGFSCLTLRSAATEQSQCDSLVPVK